jgi:hypothetical protein
MATVRDSGQTRLLRGARIALTLFSLLLPQRSVCADLPAGKVVWWGHDIWPTERHPDPTNGVVESDGEIVTNVVTVAGGLGLKNDGTVVEFRSGRYGWDAVPIGLSNIVSIAAEGGACWAIKRDGSVARWEGGDDRDANLIAGLSNVTAIAWSGDQTYLALKNDGTVLGWQIENTMSPDGTFPEPVARPVAGRGQILTNVVALVSGYQPLVLTSDGIVLCMGYEFPPWSSARSTRDEANASPPATHPEAEPPVRGATYDYPNARPVVIGGQALSNVTAIAGGDGYHVALKKDGTVVAWSGILEDEMAEPRGLSNVTAIAGSLALRKDGTVLAWGDNHFGEASVPAGLSNVVAIAGGGGHNLAITTGNIPASVFIYPHGRLEEMEREANLIFKGQVISSEAVTNALFPYWGKTHATRFSVLSVLKGEVSTNSLIFWHITHGPDAWGGGSMPSWHKFMSGEYYLIFAARLDEPCYVYTVPPDATNRPNEFRQLYRDGVMRTLDARPIGARGVKDAHWAELGLLLKDAEATNQLYAIDTLDRMSLAARHDDQWSRSDDFKRNPVLTALLPLITNKNEQVASRAISCFETESNAVARLAPFAAALARVGNESLYPTCRLAAISALSGTTDEAVSHSLGQLLTNAHENIRLGAVRLLPRFRAGFAEEALRARAGDESANVRSVVADVIGDGKCNRLLPTLTKLFDDPVGRDHLIEPLTIESLRAGQRWSNIGDVHTSAGFALVKFDPDQVADILKTNLNDPGFHINFVSKLAEKDAEPWLPELVSILEERLKQVDEFLGLPQNDPRRYANLLSDRVLIGTYAKCWEDIRQYLLKLPPKKLSNGEMDRYMDLLEKTVQPVQGMSVHEAERLYELYRTQGLTKRASEVRRKYDKTDGWWFDDFDRNHEAAVKQ